MNLQLSKSTTVLRCACNYIEYYVIKSLTKILLLIYVRLIEQFKNINVNIDARYVL